MDVLPTIVTPSDAKLLIDQVNAEYDLFDSDVSPNTDGAFRAKWAGQLHSWELFRDNAKKTVGWLNTRSVMAQTDAYHDQLQTWKTAYAALGGRSTIGPEVKPSGNTVPIIVPVALGTALLVAVIMGRR